MINKEKSKRATSFHGAREFAAPDKQLTWHLMHLEEWARKCPHKQGRTDSDIVNRVLIPLRDMLVEQGVENWGRMKPMTHEKYPLEDCDIVVPSLISHVDLEYLDGAINHWRELCQEVQDGIGGNRSSHKYREDNFDIVMNDPNNVWNQTWHDEEFYKRAMYEMVQQKRKWEIFKKVIIRYFLKDTGLLMLDECSTKIKWYDVGKKAALIGTIDEVKGTHAYAKFRYEMYVDAGICNDAEYFVEYFANLEFNFLEGWLESCGRPSQLYQALENLCSHKKEKMVKMT